MPLMVDKMLAKGAVDGRNEIVSVPSLFELEGAITTYTIFPHIFSTDTIFFECVKCRKIQRVVAIIFHLCNENWNILLIKEKTI